MIRLAALAAAALGATAGCGPAAAPRTAAVVRTPITAPGAPGPAPDGDLGGAVEQGDALYLFARDRVVIERGGTTAATAAAPDGGWAEAVALPALDDAGAWGAARTAAGELWRITATGDLEPIHDRLGLPPAARAIAASPATVAIALDDGVAILHDRRHLARFPGSPGAPTPLAAGALAAGADRIAIRRGDSVEVWNLPDQHRVVYLVPGAIATAFVARDRGDRLVIATPGAVYIESDDGRLRRVPASAEIRGLAAAGSRLWLATARGVELFQAGAVVPTAMPPAAAEHLFGLAGGDLVIATRGGVTRLSVASAEADPRWQAAVQPIVQRVCSRCHHPGGSGRVDLSTVAAWRAERGELIRRVVDTRTMPPAGTQLDDADRRTLAGWLLDGLPHPDGPQDGQP